MQHVPTLAGPPFHLVLAALSRSPLPAHEKLALVALVSLGPSGEVTASHAELAQATSLSLSAVKRAVSALWQRGLVEVRGEVQPDGQQRPNVHRLALGPWLANPGHDFYSPGMLKRFAALVAAHERAFVALFERDRAEQARDRGKTAPRSKVRTHRKHATRPWRLRATMTSEAGRALFTLGSRALQFVQKGEWVVQPAGPAGVERAADLFWWDEAHQARRSEPRAESCGPEKVLAWVQWASADAVRAGRCGVAW
jgi:Winged helix-turn-helix DNA-binding